MLRVVKGKRLPRLGALVQSELHNRYIGVCFRVRSSLLDQLLTPCEIWDVTDEEVVPTRDWVDHILLYIVLKRSFVLEVLVAYPGKCNYC